MATYAIGDVQGMYEPLMRLLEKIGYDPAADTLWFCGDLVSRGPDSLKVLRFVKGLGEGAITVLGNHDFHLLAIAEKVRTIGRNRSLADIMIAHDREELYAWLRGRPVIYVEGKNVLVHAGVLPQWSIEQAESLGREVERAIQGEERRDFFMNMYGDQPDKWDESLEGNERLRFIVNVFARMRVVTDDGRLDMAFDGPPDERPAGTLPWHQADRPNHEGYTIYCGHWAAQGLMIGEGVRGLDTGSVWGGELTAWRLDDDTLHQVPGEG